MSLEGKVEGYLYLTVEQYREGEAGQRQPRRWSHRKPAAEPVAFTDDDPVYANLLITYPESTVEEPRYTDAWTLTGGREDTEQQNAELVRELSSNTFLFIGVLYHLKWITDPQAKRELYERVMLEPYDE